MNALTDSLKKCILFKDMEHEDLSNFLNMSNYIIKKYPQGNIVVIKVKMLSLENIRKKIENFLVEEYKKRRSNIIKVSLSRKEIAEHMGIQRPSLSRELIKMKKEG
ncbi:MAG TPA: helix-turn-helix domain-containing protein [Candidatus Atribacteria bacterium]|nr:helix-turn-helix domain-containing protein [Candidatus Atribacteria bacterium]